MLPKLKGDLMWKRIVWLGVAVAAGCQGPRDLVRSDEGAFNDDSAANQASTNNAPKGATSTGSSTEETNASSNPDYILETCLPACSSKADCSLGVDAYDEDNYACVEGGCVYVGCKSDDECQSLGGYVCRETAGFSVCIPPCDVTADCDLGLAPYDSDNYECVRGGCNYTGCLSDAECSALGTFSCAPPIEGTRYCAPACATVTDCVQAGEAFNEDNYACDAGACVYLGCHSDQECSDIGDFVCGRATP